MKTKYTSNFNPELDDKTSFTNLAEIEQEAGAEFQPVDIGFYNFAYPGKQDFNSSTEIIDLLIGENPSKIDMMSYISRIESFAKYDWAITAKIAKPSVENLHKLASTTAEIETV